MVQPLRHVLHNFVGQRIRSRVAELKCWLIVECEGGLPYGLRNILSAVAQA